MCYTPGYVVLGVELRASCILGKHSVNGAVFPGPRFLLGQPHTCSPLGHISVPFFYSSPDWAPSLLALLGGDPTTQGLFPVSSHPSASRGPGDGDRSCASLSVGFLRPSFPQRKQLMEAEQPFILPPFGPS